MASGASTAYPPALDDLERDRLIEVVKDWTVGNGLSVRPPPTVSPTGSDPHGILATSVPVTLFPSPFPKACFDQAKAVQKAYNELYARISQDEGFLEQIVNELVPLLNYGTRDGMS
jgi:glutathione synthase